MTLFLIILILPASIFSQLLRFPVTERHADAKEDLKRSLNLLKKNRRHPNHYSSVLSKKHDPIYSLSLSQDRNKIAYHTTLLLGKSKESLEFMIDTGSGWLWIEAKDCQRDLKKDCEAAKGYKFYSYYDGNIAGPVAKTTIQFGKVVSPNHPLIVAKTQSQLMKNRIMGLSKSHDPEYDNFMGTLKKNKIISHVAFSLLRNPLTDKTQLIIGGADPKILKGEKVAKMKLVRDDMYVIGTDTFSLGGEVIIRGSMALVDSGNSLIAVPLHFKDRIHRAMKEKGFECEAYVESNSDFYQLGCKVESIEKLPELEVELNGVHFKIEGHQLVDRCKRNGILFGDYSCLLSIEFQKGGDMIILGKSFLAHTYTTFFLEKKELWMAQPSMHKYKALMYQDATVTEAHRTPDMSSVNSRIWTEEEFSQIMNDIEQ